jgi:hypothetical protein
VIVLFLSSCGSSNNINHSKSIPYTMNAVLTKYDRVFVHSEVSKPNDNNRIEFSNESLTASYGNQIKEWSSGKFTLTIYGKPNLVLPNLFLTTPRFDFNLPLLHIEIYLVNESNFQYNSEYTEYARFVYNIDESKIFESTYKAIDTSLHEAHHLMTYLMSEDMSNVKSSVLDEEAANLYSFCFRMAYLVGHTIEFGSNKLERRFDANALNSSDDIFMNSALGLLAFERTIQKLINDSKISTTEEQKMNVIRGLCNEKFGS